MGVGQAPWVTFVFLFNPVRIVFYLLPFEVGLLGNGLLLVSLMAVYLGECDHHQAADLISGTFHITHCLVITHSDAVRNRRGAGLGLLWAKLRQDEGRNRRRGQKEEEREGGRGERK
jgi:hypothetical protein